MGWVGLLIAAVATAGACFVVRMPGNSFSGPPPSLTPEEHELRRRLATHVRVLASDIGERNLWRADALEAAARYIGDHFRDFGYPVHAQPFEVEGRTVRNVEAPLAGLRGSFIIINAIAEITFYGRDQTGRETSVTGRVSINFGDFADPAS